MRRKTAVAGFSYLAGVFFASFLGISNILLFSGLLLLAFSVCYFIKFNKKVLTMTILMSSAVGMLIYGAFYYFDYMKTIEYDGKTAPFNGKITDFQYIENDLMIIEAKGEIENKNAKISFFAPACECDYSDEISFVGKYEVIENNVAFNSFDYSFSEGEFLKATVVSDFEITNTGFSFAREVKNFSDYIYKEITSQIDGDEGAFLGAMLCGNKSKLSDTSKTSLFRVGIGHIFSVSGTHLVIISFVFMYIISYVRLSYKAKFILNEIVLVLFSLFAGMSPSVLRATVMMTVFNLTALLRRRPDSLTTIAICGVILTVFSPENIRSASFLLSMSGAFALSVISPMVMKYIRCKKLLRPFVTNFIASLCVWAVSLPIVMMFFNNVSILSPVMNILLVPLCTVALVLTIIGVLGGFFGFINPFALTLAEAFIKPVIAISKTVSKFRFATIPFGYEEVRFVVILGLFAVLLVTILKRKAVVSIITSIVCIASFFMTSVFVTYKNRNTLEIYNVKYKDSFIIVLNKNRKSVIIDSDGKNIESCVRMLEYKGIVSVEGLVIYDNYYSSSENYASQLDFCDFDVKDSFRSEFIDTFTFDGVDIEFSEENYTVTYEGVQLTFPYTDNEKPSKNGEIYLTEIKNGKISEKRSFDYAFG